VTGPAEDKVQNDPDLAAEVLRQQQIHLVQRIPTMALTSAFNGGVVLVAFWGEVSTTMLVAWYLVVLAVSGVQVLGWRKIKSKPAPSKVSGKTLRRAKYWSGLVGLVWAAAALMFFTPHSAPHQFFLAVVSAGMAGGTVAMLSPIPALNLWFLATLLIPFGVRFAIEGDKLHLVVAALCGMYGVTLMYGSRKSYRTLVELVAYHRGLEKTRSDLEDAIESTNDAFAFFDENRRLQLANSRFREWFAGSKKIRGGDAKGQLRQLDGGRWVVSTIRKTSRGGWVSVHVDVSDLKQREEELIAAKLRAEEADRAKTQFLANMSHELRTPLNAIIGFSQMMRDQVFGVLGDARYRSYVDDIYNSGQHLLSIINDILDLSKIEFSRYELEYETVELEEVVEWCVTVCRGRDESGGERVVEVELAPSATLLDVDRRALKQILVNLLANALKFTPPEKLVGLRAQRNEAGGVDLVVWDKGIGIPADKIDDVRKPFFQAENSLVKRYRGTGLGLAIVDALARGHGGELLIDSVEGQGSTFTVRLPHDRVLDRKAMQPRRAAG
jgi:signal transduction histidine kinase